MSETEPSRPWRVYASAPPPRYVRSRRAARRLARRYARLGMTSTLFEMDNYREWVRRDRMGAQR